MLSSCHRSLVAAWPTCPAYVDGGKRENSFFYCMTSILLHPREPTDGCKKNGGCLKWCRSINYNWCISLDNCLNYLAFGFYFSRYFTIFMVSTDLCNHGCEVVTVLIDEVISVALEVTAHFFHYPLDLVRPEVCRSQHHWFPGNVTKWKNDTCWTSRNYWETSFQPFESLRFSHSNVIVN